MTLIDALNKLAELEKRATQVQAEIVVTGDTSQNRMIVAIGGVRGWTDPNIPDVDAQKMREAWNLFPELLECAKGLHKLCSGNWDGKDWDAATASLDALRKKLIGKADGKDQSK